MTHDTNGHDGLQPIAPDEMEELLGLEIDNIVPTRGYQMLPMVALGGSAGSIAALQQFMSAMPADSGMVFVVIVHLSPEHESILASLLQRSTSMRVEQVQSTVKVMPNHVYIIPPGKILTTIDGHLRLTDLVPERGRRMTVDYFFRSMADNYGPHAAAIVLSGADGDGAIGIKRIKERGGLTIAQDPDEAEHQGMPRSAISTGMVDWVLPVEDIPDRLVEYHRLESRLNIPPEEGPQPARPPRLTDGEAEESLREILAFLRTRTGRDFSYYKRATIVRRVARRLQVNGLEDLPAYLSFLRTHPGEAGALLQDLLISVTNFFRDREAFEALEAKIPALFQGKGPNDTLRVWVPACATGEEAYSIAILLCEHARTLEAPPAVQIFATDLDDDVLGLAREAIYPLTITADVSDDRLKRFFTREHRGYRIRREVRELVLFALHDLLKDSPFSRLDLVSCRNLLIYLNRDAQSRVFETFHFALRPDGLMFLGSSEAIDDDSQLFLVLDKKHRLYGHRAAPRVGLPISTGPSTLAMSLSPHLRSKEGPVIARRAMDPRSILGDFIAEAAAERSTSWSEVHLHLIERFAPPSVIVDQDFNILHLSENAGRLLQLSGGEPSRNLLRIVHPMLRIELRAALYRAMQATDEQPPETQRVVGVPIEIEGHREAVTMHVMLANDIAQGAVLVVFETRPAATEEVDQPPVVRDTEPVARDLERELERIKSHLRDTVEQYEASTEELKAGNEELQAMNEELRSATEELETSREELQSINEELTTVNHELKNKVDELGSANSDLHNLMASTAIATIFVDRDLRITRYTPRAVEIFSLIPTDVGRPLADLRHRLDYADLQKDAARVLETLAPIERSVGDQNDRWFLSRLLPYRTLEDRIGGVVLTFVDVTERMRAEQAARETAAEFRAVFQSTSVGMLQADPETGRLLDVNQKLCHILDETAAAMTKNRFENLPVESDRDAFRSQLARLLAGEIPEFSIELRLTCRSADPIWVHLNVTVIRDAGGRPRRVVAVVLDITERQIAEAALRLSEERLRDANAALDERVQERTRNLRESESQLKETAATSSKRADQLQLLASQLSMVEQQERRRLAEILHDHIQQILVAAKMRVDLVISDLENDELQRRLAQVNQMLDDSINAARSLSVELAPPLLHDQGLPAALEWLGSRLEELHRIPVHIDVDLQADVANIEYRDLLFQAARELLLNVVKHAKAPEVWLRFTSEGGRSRLEIEDHGAGFDPDSALVDRQTFGLFYIRERIQAVGGTFKLRSAPGAGTLAVIIV